MKNHQLVVSQWLEHIGKEHAVSLLLEKDEHCIIPCEDGLNDDHYQYIINPSGNAEKTLPKHSTERRNTRKWSFNGTIV